MCRKAMYHRLSYQRHPQRRLVVFSYLMAHSYQEESLTGLSIGVGPDFETTS